MLGAGGNIRHIQVVIACKGNHGRIRGICKIYGILRPDGETSVLFRSSHTAAYRRLPGIIRKGGRISIFSIVRKHDLMVGNPFPCGRDFPEILRYRRQNSRTE